MVLGLKGFESSLFSAKGFSLERLFAMLLEHHNIDHPKELLEHRINNGVHLFLDRELGFLVLNIL